MATVAEKVQGVSGEGHQKVKNDHEQFLEAYENPTLIYKVLQARNSMKPLYLQRNLSYMLHRTRRSQRRYKRKFIKGSKLPRLGLQPNRKVDLVSEIKSDSCLEISFCCLVKGQDHTELLDARVNHDSEAQATGKNEADPPEQKPEIVHGTLMEVELLLFRFKQSNICLSGEPCPCHCSSLGKKTLEYRSNVSVDAKELVHAPALTLSIPESMFTWTANSGERSQMLVFKASYVPKPVTKKAPVPIHLPNFVSRKGCCKSMVLSVNRLSISKISQKKIGGIVWKMLVQSSSGCLSIEKKDSENEEMGQARSSLPSAPDYQHLHDHQYTSSYSSSQSTAVLEDNLLSSHSNSMSKGYADKCTSTKFTFKNGTSSKKEQDMLKKLEGVYSGEIAVFDSRGEYLIKDGQYSILLQKEGEENNSTFKPLTWTTILGNQNCSKNSENSSVNFLLKISLAWSGGPPQHRLCSKMRITVDLQQICNKYFECLPSSVIPNPPPLVAPGVVSSSNLPLSFPQPQHIVQDFMEQIPSPAVCKLVGLPPDEEEENESVLHSPPMNPLLGQPAHGQSKVIFNYLYSENGLQKTESQTGMVCPWCCLSCGKIYALLKHMSVCHPRFHFTYSMSSQGDHIVDVHVNEMYDMTSSSMDIDPGEWNDIALARQKNGPSKCLSCMAVFVDRHVVVKEDLSEFLNDGSWRRGYNVNRVYHHCCTCLPLLQDEVELEKEEKKKALQWQQISSEKMINEFTDVSKGEKELITLWNAFVMDKRFIAEKQVPLVCFKFAQEVGPTLVKKGLVPNFMAHLVNLIEYGQISLTTLKNCMKTVRDLKTGVS